MDNLRVLKRVCNPIKQLFCLYGSDRVTLSSSDILDTLNFSQLVSLFVTASYDIFDHGDSSLVLFDAPLGKQIVKLNVAIFSHHDAAFLGPVAENIGHCLANIDLLFSTDIALWHSCFNHLYYFNGL